MPNAKGVAITADINRNITDIITVDFLSRLIANRSLKSFETFIITSAILEPLLRPSSIIIKILSSSLDFNLLLIAIHASSKFLPIRISRIVLRISSYKGPSPYFDMSSIAFSKLRPTFNIEDNCLRKSGADCSILEVFCSCFTETYV